MMHRHHNSSPAGGGGWRSPHQVSHSGTMAHHHAPNLIQAIFLDEVCILETRDRSVFSAVPYGQLQHSGGDLSGGGSSEDEIGEKLRTRSGGGDGKMCVVCQEEMGRRRIGILRCGHEYDASCIRRWLRRNNICPLCKATAL